MAAATDNPLSSFKLDIGVRLGARSRQDRLYGCFVNKVKFKYKYDNTLKTVLLG
jgi:hypothetical protein